MRNPTSYAPMQFSSRNSWRFSRYLVFPRPFFGLNEKKSLEMIQRLVLCNRKPVLPETRANMWVLLSAFWWYTAFRCSGLILVLSSRNQFFRNLALIDVIDVAISSKTQSGLIATTKSIASLDSSGDFRLDSQFDPMRWFSLQSQTLICKLGCYYHGNYMVTTVEIDFALLWPQNCILCHNQTTSTGTLFVNQYNLIDLPYGSKLTYW